MYFQFRSFPEHMAAGLRLVAKAFPARFNSTGTPVRFHHTPKQDSSRLQKNDGELTISYDRASAAFRSLGSLLSHELEKRDILIERRDFDSLGILLDVSRNGVLHLERIEKLFVQLALAGIDTVQLYMEDIYSLPGEPLIGYARGAYTQEELKRIDDCGYDLGIEVIPCIQTLGHLDQILQWPAYEELIDVPGVLLIGAEKTYQLIEKMIDAVSSSFRSRKIHIGMDEAHGVGQGRYRRLHGERRTFDILNEHLSKVVQFCETRGLHPMMWSDMYFRLGSAKNDYYDLAAIIPEEIGQQIPPGVDLVYWDYYHTDAAFYDEWIRRHRSLGKEPIFAAGLWTWGRFFAHLPHAFATLSAGMKAARANNLKHAFAAIWGDDANECDPASMLAPIYYFAECAYAPADEMPQLERIKNRLAHLCQADLESHRITCGIDCLPEITEQGASIANFGKWLLWHDPVLNFLHAHIPPSAPDHYHQVAEQLAQRYADYESTYGKKTEGALHQAFAVAIARTLAAKVRLHLESSGHHRSGNVQALTALKDEVLADAIQAVEQAWELHRTIWHLWFKPFGWEVLDRRYAGIVARLHSFGRVLERACTTPEAPIPELVLEYHPTQPNIPIHDLFITYAQASTTTLWR